MEDQQCDPCAEITVVDLKPLTFDLAEDNGTAAIYVARVDEPDAPGGPEYALTVTVASPRQDAEAKAEIDAFLSEMRAAFLLTAPNPDEDSPDDQEPGPFDIAAEIQIVPELVQLRTLKGTFGVTAIVRTEVEEGDTEAVESFAEPATGPPDPVRHKIGAGKNHRYTAKGGIKTATAAALKGSGNIRPPVKAIFVGGSPQSVTAKTVIVHGVTACTYNFAGKFNG